MRCVRRSIIRITIRVKRYCAITYISFIHLKSECAKFITVIAIGVQNISITRIIPRSFRHSEISNIQILISNTCNSDNTRTRINTIRGSRIRSTRSIGHHCISRQGWDNVWSIYSPIRQIGSRNCALRKAIVYCLCTGDHIVLPIHVNHQDRRSFIHRETT